jgi:hypothetical protein
MDYLDTMGYSYTKGTEGGEVPVTTDELPAPVPEPTPTHQPALVRFCGNWCCGGCGNCAGRRASAQE